ncbi:MAG: hydrogenase maturation protease [Promethearchaeota archaeon]|nr:MAG: hydrogenase maturation protease [Candidatus Lokiarchaeota archaeon]
MGCLIPKKGMEEIFKRILAKVKDASKIVFMGIGEEKLTDDGVGPYIISKLLHLTNQKFLFINAGIDPMARIDDIVNFKPSHLVLIDTCTLKKEPGTISILERENMSNYIPISSHTIPIHIVIDLLVNQIQNLEVFMIGFVPQSLEGFTELRQFRNNELSLEELDKNIDLPFFEIHLTDTVQRSADKVIEVIKKLIDLL